MVRWQYSRGLWKWRAFFASIEYNTIFVAQNELRTSLCGCSSALYYFLKFFKLLKAGMRLSLKKDCQRTACYCKKDCQRTARYCSKDWQRTAHTIVEQCRLSAYHVRTCISIPLHKQYPVGLGEMIPDARSNFLNGAPPPLGVYYSSMKVANGRISLISEIRNFKVRSVHLQELS